VGRYAMVHEHEPCIFVVACDVVRDSLRFAFEVEGFRVCDYGSARALLNAAPKGQPGYLVVDDTLPDMNGVELLRRLREAHVELPALMIVSAPTGAVRSMAALVGICIVEKPLIGDTLVENVRTLAQLSPSAHSCGAPPGALIR